MKFAESEQFVTYAPNGTTIDNEVFPGQYWEEEEHWMVEDKLEPGGQK